MSNSASTGMPRVCPMGTSQPGGDAPGVTGQILKEQKTAGGQDGMPDSPLREAFELLHYYLLHNEEFGVRVSVARMSIGEEVEIDPDYAIGEAVRTGLVMVDEDFLLRRILRRGPRNAEMLRRIYGSDGPPTVESLLAEERAWSEYERKAKERLRAIREAARPKERNTVASLPAWVP